MTGGEVDAGRARFNPRNAVKVILLLMAVMLLVLGEGAEAREGRRRGRERRVGKEGRVRTEGRGGRREQKMREYRLPGEISAKVFSILSEVEEPKVKDKRVKGRRKGNGRRRNRKQISEEQADFPQARYGAVRLLSDSVTEIFRGGIPKVKAAVEKVVGRFKNREEELSAAAQSFVGRLPWELNKDICPVVLCGPKTPGPVSLHGTPAREPKAQDSAHLTSHNSAGQQKKKFAFFEGDIVLDDEMEERMRGGRREKRAIIRPISRLWKYGIVPYIIDQSLSANVESLIMEAFDQIQRDTCIRFREKLDSDKDFIHYIYSQGCWSLVGMTGKGRQYISLGDGCDNVGTIVHETAHALGFWHEQSRLDRDDFVKVINKNIPTYYRDQFGKRSADESTSRGFAYDYVSIMHYGHKYFTENGRPTLKVVGVGKEQKLNIGQRKHLSNIDIAQLRAMYHCNTKQANTEACKPGWIKNQRMCYRFYSDEKKHFSAAQRKCDRVGGRLLKINNEKEDDFIKNHLISRFPNQTEWRAGGRLEKPQGFVWVGKVGHTTENMSYTAWAPGNPGYQKSLILKKFNGTPPRFVWKGDSTSRKANFICEANLNIDCIPTRFADARDYRGFKSYTTAGVTCQNWNSQYPHQHTWLTGNRARDSLNGLGDHNYCRNPGGRRERPWCYVPLKDTKWQYCDVEVCQM